MKLSICLTGALMLLAATDYTRAGDTVVNPTGTWELKSPSTSPQPPSQLKLKLEGNKLTGTLSRNAGSRVEQLPLENAKLSGGEISFTVHVYALQYENNVLQPTDTNKVTHSKYQGLINSDTIKGKVEKTSWREEGNRTLDWEAKRVKK